MTTPAEEQPSFNLWYEPWITLEDAKGNQTRYSIADALLQAHRYTAITEISPLVEVGIRRLLTAILQAIFDPRQLNDLHKLLGQGAFPPDPIQQFGRCHAPFFDLFSPDTPFLQSADLPLQPQKGDKVKKKGDKVKKKGDKVKTVAYLAPEIPAGSESIHFRHGSDDTYALCPVCVAGLLTALPAFATVGGRGLKPSINGVPPIYVLPEGQSLFESLVRSLVLPGYQPPTRSQTYDLAWWERKPKPIVELDREVIEVGYLHSLTFPVRRIRLHPERLDDSTLCSRCGSRSLWGVRTMVFAMGEARPKDTPPWFDPFAAYVLPQDKKGSSAPKPVRPQPNHALWREFASLFLMPSQKHGAQQWRRPTVLDQLVELTDPYADPAAMYTFRCVGLRTNMDTKVFEWVEAGFEVPPPLLCDPIGSDLVKEALVFADECDDIIQKVFTSRLRGDASLRTWMQQRFWEALAAPFRQLMLQLAVPNSAQRLDARKAWMERCLREARDAFHQAAEQMGEDTASLRQCVESENILGARLNKLRKEYLPNE